MWQLVVGFNLLIAGCYLAIACVIIRGLVRTGQLRRNPLALATSAIFLSCALHHGAHALYVLHPLGYGAVRTDAVRELYDTPLLLVIDMVGAIVALIYLGLRRSFGTLLNAPGMFGDAADRRYRELAANLPHLSVFSFDLDLRFVVVEGSDVAAAGYDPEAMVGRYVYDVLPAETWSNVERHYRGALAGETSEFDTVGRLGTTYKARAIPMRDEAGVVTGGLLIAEDVTTQREAAAKLAAAQAFNEAVLAASPDAAMTVDLETYRVQWASRLPSQTLNWPSQPPDQDDWSALLGLVDPDDLKTLAALNDDLALLPDGEFAATRCRLRRPDGTLRWMSMRVTPFARDAGGAPSGALCVVRDVTDVVEAERQLEHTATHDSLTGLPNRAVLLELVASALARHREDAGEMYLLFCDLDDFKEINDTYGHAAGDAVLVEVSRRLRGALREGDAVARVGGDEFVVLLERPSSGAVGQRPARPSPEAAAPFATALAERIRREVCRPIEHDGSRLEVSMSLGMTSVRGGATAAETLRDADAAMYLAKQHGRNRVEVFDDVLQARRDERRQIVER